MVLVTLMTLNGTVNMDSRCIHEMLEKTCAICLKLELPNNVASDEFYCGQCGEVVWRGDFYSLKWTVIEGVRRQRKVGMCCSDEDQ